MVLPKKLSTSSSSQSAVKRRLVIGLVITLVLCLVLWELLHVRNLASVAALNSSSRETRGNVVVHNNELNSFVVSDRNATNSKILIATFLFGEKTLQKRSIRLFVESARRSGVDIAIVGYPAPPFPLPPNVRYVKATWDDLTDRVRDRVFHGREPGEMRRVKYFYKINDFKPLFAYLFPEQVEGYGWWGYIDSDVVLGNLRTFLTPELLSRYDIICPIRDQYTLGPFTLYRNAPVVNELFRLARRPLLELFGTKRCRSFDEYGGISYGTLGYNDFRSSMGGIIEHYRKQLGIRWYGFIPIAWDGFCRGYLVGGVCRECHLLRLPNNSQQLMQHCFGVDDCNQEVSFCHYQYSKATMEASLRDNVRMEQLVQEGQFRINFLEGFDYINSTVKSLYLEGTEMLQMPPFDSSAPRTMMHLP